ncbi:FAD-binding oxidoreductase [Terasakiella sp. A23]|uniref:FAD-binding oxidoreductase n=1 Tax=Terasakiella sp. FCG-A23 TaxID=3080561 RepID=UPI00295473B5|nr:FAD-binding oxidoreductase [Terasakiella sp. A23]MDV7339281.1 FAD-binding oxidoreductase [Terasakiella sp. A23]
MPFSAANLQTLKSIVGDKGFITDQNAIAPYLEESRGRFKGQCDVLIKPASVQEVSEVLAICNDENIPVVPQGGNTGHCGGAVPNGGVLLNLSRLNKIRSIDPMNATITVEAGCILQDIQIAARKAGFLFPLSLASEGTCQIGGNLSTNAGGVQVLRYGNARELTLGLEAVLADGQVWNGLRGLRKDNTGYDLKHMFIGAEGTLGIITSATLKLYPLPKETVTCFVGAESVAHLMDGFSQLRDCFAGDLSAFEILPRFGLETVCKHIHGMRDPFAQTYPWYGLIEVSTPRSNTNLRESMEEQLNQLLERDILHDVLIAETLIQAENFWSLRENMSEAQKHEGGSVKHDVSVPVSKVADFMNETSHMISNIMPQARLCTFGHLGDGNIHFNISQPVDMDKDAFLAHTKDFNEIVHEMAEKYDGSFSAEHGIGLLKTKEMETFRAGPELDMMRQIKQALDPNNILNPGKVVG